ncbi:MAG: GNAT family N-acetyltransferase [Bacteriovorax sp.]|nr:GNAT family N-acetyltransferase [Bacteriovorax sp.]
MENINDSLKFYQANIADIPKILPLFNAYRQFYRHDIDPASEKFLRDRLNNKESLIFYAEDANGVQGFIQIYPSFSSRSLGPTWILNDLYVKPDARRKKIAWKLFDESIHLARETKIHSVSLSTLIPNISAQEFYKKYGFKKDNDFFHFYFKL